MLKWSILSTSRAYPIWYLRNILGMLYSHILEFLESQSLNSGSLKLLSPVSLENWIYINKLFCQPLPTATLPNFTNDPNFQFCSQTFPDICWFLWVWLSLKIHLLSNHVPASVCLNKTVKMLKLYISKILVLWKPVGSLLMSNTLLFMIITMACKSTENRAGK